MTYVVDASAIAELLLGTARGQQVAGLVRGQVLVAPAHLPVEVLSVLRGWERAGHLSAEEGHRALVELAELGIEVLPGEAVLEAAWELRHNPSAYDAPYVVMARRLGAQLLTLDARLAKAAPDCATLVPSGS